MVHESSGIESLHDLENITLATTLTGSFSLYLRKKVPLENVEIVPYSGSVAQFLLRDDFAQQAYIFSEPFAAEQKGAKTRCLLLSEIGFNPYTSVLITSEDMIREKPQIVEKMVRASIRGWTTYTEDDGLASNWVYSIAVAPDGVVWVGTDEGGVSRFDGELWTVHPCRDRLASDFIKGITQAPDGALWFGTTGGISRFDGETWTSYTTADGLADNDAAAIAVAPDGTVWVGTDGRGVSRFDGRNGPPIQSLTVWYIVASVPLM